MSKFPSGLNTILYLSLILEIAFLISVRYRQCIHSLLFYKLIYRNHRESLSDTRLGQNLQRGSHFLMGEQRAEQPVFPTNPYGRERVHTQSWDNYLSPGYHNHAPEMNPEDRWPNQPRIVSSDDQSDIDTDVPYRVPEITNCTRPVAPNANLSRPHSSNIYPISDGSASIVNLRRLPMERHWENHEQPSIPPDDYSFSPTTYHHQGSSCGISSFQNRYERGSSSSIFSTPLSTNDAYSDGMRLIPPRRDYLPSSSGKIHEYYYNRDQHSPPNQYQYSHTSSSHYPSPGHIGVRPTSIHPTSTTTTTSSSIPSIPSIPSMRPPTPTMPLDKPQSPEKSYTKTPYICRNYQQGKCHHHPCKFLHVKGTIDVMMMMMMMMMTIHRSIVIYRVR